MGLMNALRKEIKESKLGSSKEYIDSYRTGYDYFDYKNGMFNAETKEYVLGLNAGSILTVVGKSGSGKAQPNSTKIPMADGSFKLLGDVEIGDKLFDRTGKPTTVTGVYPKGEREVYELTFRDGRKALCNDDHIWTYFKYSHGKYIKKTNTLRHIIDNENLNWISIPMNEAVEYEEIDYAVHPYIVGALIGDGIMGSSRTTISSDDAFVVDKISDLLPYKNHSVKLHKSNYSWVFKLDEELIKITKPTEHIKNGRPINLEFVNNELLFSELDGLYKSKSYEKHIPEIYKRGSIEQRKDLVRGLLDTDGSVAAKNRLLFNTSSFTLAKDLVEILRTLGISATIQNEDVMPRGNEVYPNYTVSISTYAEIKKELLSLPRKRDKIDTNRKELNYDKLKVTSIKKLDEVTEMTCIMVDNEEHLYQTEDYIVTHNTTLAIQMAANIVDQFDEAQIIHLDFERATRKERILTLTGWSEKHYNEKYMLLNSAISAESVYELAKGAAKVKLENKEQYQYDTGKVDLDGNPIMELPPTVIIIDSIATMFSKNINDEDALSGQMSASAQARANNAIFKRLVGSSTLEEGNIILVCVNHVTQKISINPMMKPSADVNFLKPDESVPQLRFNLSGTINY
jgi:hypothetical protein